MVTLKVRGDTPTQKLAGAIVKHLRDGEDVDVSTIGAYALQRGIRACVVARRFLKQDEEKSDLIVLPEIYEVVFDDSTENKGKSCVILHIYKTKFDESRAVKDYSKLNGQ